MFDSLKGMGQMAALLKNKEALAEAGKRIQATLEERRVTADLPDKSVGITITGKLKVVAVRVDPALVASAAGDPAVHERLERLLVGAFNAASARAQEIARDEIQKEAAALGLDKLPGLDKILG